MKLPFAYYGAPILRKKVEAVQEVTDEIRKFIRDMEETMHAHHGMGLAAPQVCRSQAIFIICPPIPINNPDEPEEYAQGKIQVFINPKLSNPSNTLVTINEGCLSIPNVRGDVTRPESVTVEALDENGTPFIKKFSGLEARIIMHENDHLNGVLFIDRLQDLRLRKKIEPLLRAIKKEFNKD